MNIDFNLIIYWYLFIFYLFYECNNNKITKAKIYFKDV